MAKKTKVRIFIERKMEQECELVLEEAQAHYLCNVLRLEPGDEILAFDGENGEFLCRISEIGKKKTKLEIIKKTKDFCQVPDVWILFAPVKKDKTDYIIEKATELGAREIGPVITARTIAEKVRIERFRAQAIEASEQSRRVDIPNIRNAQTLEKIVGSWDKTRVLYFMDESGNGGSVKSVFEKQEKNRPAAILVGPEGGFEDEELEMLRRCEFAKGVSLGGRILRAETAVAAALACWQAITGDWN